MAKYKYVYRSAVTGKFVTEKYANRYPKKTIKQRIKVEYEKKPF